jgi:hypothetical protein
MVPVSDRREVARSWTHWVLRQYADQGSSQAMAKMFWVILVDNF